MCAFFLRNGSKAHHLWRRPSIESWNIKNHIVHHQLQHSKVYSRLPHSFYRKTKELELSNPTFLAFFSGISSSASKVRFVGWYLEKLNSRPIITKTITCCLILTAADFSSQVLFFSKALKEKKKILESYLVEKFIIRLNNHACCILLSEVSFMRFEEYSNAPYSLI